MTRRRTVQSIDFSKGFYSSPDPSDTPEGYLYNVKNLMPSGLNNSLMVRPGIANLAPVGWPTGTTMSSGWSGLSSYQLTNQSSVIVATTSGTGHQFDTRSGAYSTYTNMGNIIIQYKDVLYGGSLSGVYQSSGSANGALIAGSPTGFMLEVHKDRLFVANGSSATATTPYRLYYSEAADFSATGWPGANFLDVHSSVGDAITGLKSMGDKLIIFKGKSIWVLYTSGVPANWRLTLLSNSVGCFSKNSIKEYEGLVYFTGISGVYRTDGIKVEKISQALEYADFVRPGDLVRWGYVGHDICGIYEDYYVVSPVQVGNLVTASGALGTVFKPGYLYAYHVPTATWWQWYTSVRSGVNSNLGFWCRGEGIASYTGYYVIEHLNQEASLSGAAFLGFIRDPAVSPFVINDNGIAIDYSLQTANVMQDLLGVNKKYIQLHLQGEGVAAPTFGFKIDEVNYARTGATASTREIFKIPIMVFGNRFNVTVSGAPSGTASKAILQKAQLEYAISRELTKALNA